MANTLYYGDNLDVLGKHFADESIDLIYLDPPFNSNRDYNVLFKDQSGAGSPAQIKAFTDTWNWAGAAEYWDDFHSVCPVPGVIELMGGFINTLGKNDVTAYLVMMAPRLYHLHRILKPTGSIYLHCDPTASHYLKLVLDATFGPTNYRNEISWRRSNPKSHGSINFANCRDIILRYSKTSRCTFNPIFGDHDPKYVESAYKYTDPDGRRYRLLPLLNPNDNRPNLTYDFLGVLRVWRWTRERMEQAYADGQVVQLKEGAVPQYKLYLDESKGRTISNDWNDIGQVAGNEVLGYPTQKPLALLERIILSSSNRGDTVLDPFCGCGTAVIAAQKLGREWRGIDVTPIATSLIQKRLWDAFEAKDRRLLRKDDPAREKGFDVVGLPTDTDGARQLFLDDHKKFEMWCVGLVPAIPQEKKGADQGIDGLAYFNDGGKKPSKAIVQVKGGHVTSSQIRDLRGTKERESAALALFICLDPSTKPMRDEALEAGYYTPPYGGKKVQAVQVLTVKDLLDGMKFALPFSGSNTSYLQSEKAKDGYSQPDLDLP